MRHGLIIAVRMVIAACGPAQGASRSVNGPASSPLPRGFLVLLLRPNAPEANTKVEIVDLTGKVVASADLSALPLPTYGSGCGPVVSPMIRVAARSAYFVDSTGVVHRLDPDGSTSQIATLILNPHPLLSFAVSPDGKHVIAIVVNAPANGTWALDLENAAAGGPSSVALHKTLVQRPTEIVGWDNAGPTATLDSLTCVQQAPPSLEYPGLALVHLALDGTHLDRIGGSDCIPWDELLDGTVLCGSPGWDSFTVRTSTGSVLWGRQEGLYAEPRLSPDGRAVAFNGPTATILTATSERPASSARQTPPIYAFLGWAGNSEIVVVRDAGHLGLAPATGPAGFRDLGLVVGNPCVGCGSQRVYLAGTIGVT